MLTELDLRDYQQRAIKYILDKKRCGLAIDMGLGKTIIALTSFVRLHNCQVKKVLIIAPLNVAKNVWANEIAKWDHTRHLTYSICCGDERERFENLKKEVDIYIINQENVEWMREKGFDKYGMIIVDESHKFKNYASFRFKALENFICKFIVLLSGTPMPNGYEDIWSQQFLIDRGKAIGHNITAYRKHYFITQRDNKHFCLYPDLISKRISNNWLYMKAEDYISLPDKITIPISIKIDNYHLYKIFEKKFILKIKDVVLTAVNAGVLCNKLLQYCNGAVYDENKEYVEIHDNKLDMLEELIEDHPEENVLVAFNFKSDEERIKKRLKEAITLTSKNINEMEKRWNNGEIKLLLCQCNSAEGLNLQQGGRIIIWFGLTWRMDSYKQFNARLHRQGQTKPVLVYHLVSKDCKDEEVMKVLANKNATQEDLFEVLKNDQSTKE